MNYKTYLVLLRRGFFEAFNIKTMADLRYIINKYKFVHFKNNDIHVIKR